MAAGGNSSVRHKNTLAERKQRAAGRRNKSEDAPVREFAGRESQSLMAPAGGAGGRKGTTRKGATERGIAGGGGGSSGDTNVVDVGRSTRPARKRKA